MHKVQYKTNDKGDCFLKCRCGRWCKSDNTGRWAFCHRCGKGIKRPVKCINHLDFFAKSIGDEIKLSNDIDCNIFASWKVGGQEFYIYGIES
jgi:hypothetical protein